MNCKRRYTDLIKSLDLEYSNDFERNFDLNEISLLASRKPSFSLKTNFWIGGYQRFFITVSATRPWATKFWKTFVKTLTFRKIQACHLYLSQIRFYWTNIYQCYFYTHWNNHSEVFYTPTFNSITQLDHSSIRLYIFKSELTYSPCLLAKSTP